MKVSHSRHITILLVDDEPEVLRLFKRIILSSEGSLILTAQTGAEALEIARQTRLDLALLDIRLPDVEGTKVLQALRRIDPALPIIMVTSYGSFETVRASMELGAIDYLTKPFDNKEIRQVVREALASRAGPPAGRAGRPR